MVKKYPKKSKIKSVSKESLKLTDENLEKLKKIFPGVFSEGKIDFEKLKILLGSEIEDGIEKYNFTWAGKSNAFRNIQTTAKGTLTPDEKDSVDFDNTENLFIEGDNLEVLKLLQKSYQSKVKMIYIDPPYNTGKDFVYKDNFRDSIGNYQKMTGLVDEEGNKTDTNKETNGRFHSDWLTMMYPRLYLAKNLLKDDGVIFVSIDDHEVHNLRKIMDDIFGEENFIGNFIRKTGIAARLDAKHISIETDYILCYSKNIDNLKLNKESAVNFESYNLSDEFLERRGKYKLNKLDRGSINYSNKMDYPIESPDGTKIYPGGKKEKNNWCWRWSREKVDWGIKNKFIEFNKSKKGWQVYFKQYQFVDNNDNLIERENPFKNLLIKEYNNELATKEVLKLFDNKVFDYPKPTSLIKHFLEITTKKDSNDIILDFFAGSGTTAHAVLDLNKEDKGNRKFICVQLPEKTDEKSEAYKAGYKTISDIAKERIRRVIKKIKEEDKEKAKNMDLGFKVFKLSKSNYKIWENYNGKDAKELLKQMELFQSPLISGYKKINLIYEILIKEGYDLNSKVEEVKGIKTNKVFKVGKDEKFFYICLDDKIKDQTIKDLKLGKETMFVCLDESLTDNQKINLNLKINLRSI